MDDFGTKYSSLNYLSALPFDTLKIDKSYVDNIIKNYRDQVIVQNIIKMTKDLMIETVAEGVEYDNQAQLLFKMGCTYGQGYLVSQPLSASMIRSFITI